MNHNPTPRGFAALISVLIISAILVVLTLSESTAAFFARADLYDAESKKQAVSIARGCIEAELLRLAEDSAHTAHNFCVSVFTSESNGDLLITAVGKSGVSWARLVATIYPRSSSAVPTPGIPRFQIVSIKEVSGT